MTTTGALPVLHLGSRQLLVGFLLTQYLTRQTSDVASEKQMLIAQVREGVAMVKEARSLFDKCCSEATSEERRRLLIASMRMLSMQVTTTEELLKHCEIADCSKRLTTVKRQLLAYKRFLTGKLPAEPSREDVAGADVTCQGLARELMLLTIDISRT